MKIQGHVTFSDAQCQDQRQWAETRTQEVPSELQEALLCCTGDTGYTEKLRSLLFEEKATQKNRSEDKHPEGTCNPSLYHCFKANILFNKFLLMLVPPMF